MSKKVNRGFNLRQRKILLLCMAAAAVVVSASLVALALNGDEYVYVEELLRPDEDEGQRSYELEIVRDKAVDKVTVYVDTKKHTEEELDKLFDEAEKLMVIRLLGENTQMDCVTMPLNLISTLPEYNMEVQWFISDTDVIDYWGDIYRKNEIRSVNVTATLLYGGRVMDGLEASREYTYSLTVLPCSEKQLDNISLDKLFDDADKDSEGMDRIMLPNEYEGEKIQYRMKADKGLYKLFFIVPVIAAGLIVEMHSKQAQKRKKLKEQLAMEYPEIISKLSLLTASGMTPYNALKKIAADGEGEAYQRLSVVIGNIQSGASERSQYAAFGQIFGLYCYSRLGSMLEQNVVRGNERLRAMLREECTQALEERKARARRAGEQAGTKMLFPMMLMLVVVMTVIMVPAFMGM